MYLEGNGDEIQEPAPVLWIQIWTVGPRAKRQKEAVTGKSKNRNESVT